ncbi:hypothetical protein GFL92_01520 [Rhizobium leguminosarum bv. viciae]|nr:hypothetical protein [Rhizobium leguminosarum bv. viciae]
MKSSKESVAVPNEMFPIPQAAEQKTDDALEARTDSSCVATKLMEPLLRYHTISATIMIGFVLAYADSRQPTISELYRRYRSEVAYENSKRPQGPPIPLLSKHLFRSSIDNLEPGFVLTGRYGLVAASLEYPDRECCRTAKARAIKNSLEAI